MVKQRLICVGEGRMIDPQSKTRSGNPPVCSFCGRTEREVTRLHSGPGVFICNDCVTICSEVDRGIPAPEPRAVESELNSVVAYRWAADPQGIRLSYRQGSREIARAYLYIMRNDLHKKPFGLMEDVFVDESVRGHGLGTKLVKEVIEAAEDAQCYKLVATSRDSRSKVHELYRRLGFSDHGREFRMDFE